MGDREAQLINITGIYDYITARGFKKIVRMYPARSGKYYVKIGDGFYTVSDFMGYKRNRFYFRRDGQEAVKLMAEFHRCAEGYIPPAGGKAGSDWGVWMERYKNECRRIKKLRDELMRKEIISHFEGMFLSSCEIYIKRMEKAADILRGKGYLSIVEDSMKRHQMCMGGLKESSLCKCESGINLSFLDKCRYDIVERDLAELLERIFLKAHQLPESRLKEYIGFYGSIRPLSINSIDMIKAFIMYPREYEKVCSKYCKGSGRWTEERYLEKLKSAMETEDRKLMLAGLLGHGDLTEGSERYGPVKVQR
jgi:CotS family spore coat protein